ncbi:hypothetical protein HanPSC8_Chr16g0722101 [Helianthus annuus]|nr:hypothetical protein HanPSC8_Chr16g0722101 [Helianthus annuus]
MMLGKVCTILESFFKGRCLCIWGCILWAKTNPCKLSIYVYHCNFVSKFNMFNI